MSRCFQSDSVGLRSAGDHTFLRRLRKTAFERREGIEGHADSRNGSERDARLRTCSMSWPATAIRSRPGAATTDGFRDGIRSAKVDLADPPAMRAAIEEANPDVIIHAAAVSSAEAVLRQAGPRAGTSTFEAPRSSPPGPAENRRRILFTSTDLVFDGARSWYREDDQTAPTLEYGRTKLAAEAPVLANRERSRRPAQLALWADANGAVGLLRPGDRRLARGHAANVLRG